MPVYKTLFQNMTGPNLTGPHQARGAQASMKLYSYIFKEINPPFWVGLGLYSTLFLFGYFFVGSQWLEGVNPVKILEWLIYQLPDTFVKAFPMAIVLMVVVAIGRLTSEREIVAMSAGGISLSRIAWPVMVVALSVSLTALVLSEFVTPKANLEVRRLWYEELPSSPQGLSRLAGSTVSLGAGLELYFEGYDSSTQNLLKVRLANWSGKNGTLVFADSAQYNGTTLKLKGAETFGINFEKLKLLEGANDYGSLLGALRQGFPVYNPSSSADSTLTVQTGTSRAQAIAKYADGFAAQYRSLSTLLFEMGNPLNTVREKLQARIEFNANLALPFANLVLALISLPFAMRFGRGRGVSLGISLVIVVGYYLIFAVGRAAAGAGVLPPEIGLWMANIVCGVWGLRLITKGI